MDIILHHDLIFFSRKDNVLKSACLSERYVSQTEDQYMASQITWYHTSGLFLLRIYVTDRENSCQLQGKLMSKTEKTDVNDIPDYLKE